MNEKYVQYIRKNSRIFSAFPITNAKVFEKINTFLGSQNISNDFGIWTFHCNWCNRLLKKCYVIILPNHSANNIVLSCTKHAEEYIQYYRNEGYESIPIRALYVYLASGSGSMFRNYSSSLKKKFVTILCDVIQESFFLKSKHENPS